MKKRWLILFLLFVPVMNVKGLYCSYNDISYYKKLASNINVSYDFIENNQTVSFTITLVNLQPDLYLVDTVTGNTYYYTGNEITLDGYKSGQTVQFIVRTNKDNCQDQILSTIRLSLPTYNPYYQDAVCAGLSDYSLCSRWSSHGLGYNAFVKRVEQYKNSIIPEDPTTNPIDEPDNSIIQYLIKLASQYYYIVLIVVILGSGIGIYIVNKKSNLYY